MANDNREVWITGIGFVSSFGEGTGNIWSILGGDKAPEPVLNADFIPPYVIHPIPALDWSKQIEKRGDVRQMENWQRLGTYTAGMALEDAGIKGDAALLDSMDLVVAAGGGERDIASDNTILEAALSRNDREMLVNERLPVDLRPTLFLAQLSNLLAGNISIVHKVTGSSRTYMGEENAGVTAVENALSRISSGSSTHALVGGSFHADRLDTILPHELGHKLLQGKFAPILARQKTNPGMVLGSGGAFLVLEEAEHAKARGAKPYAKIAAIASDLGPREENKTFERLERMLGKLGITDDKGLAILSGASGDAGATALEQAWIAWKFPDTPARFFNSMIGQMLEANFPAGIALAALALQHNAFYPVFEPAEKAATSAPSSILVTSIGHMLGEGLALIEKA